MRPILDKAYVVKIAKVVEACLMLDHDQLGAGYYCVLRGFQVHGNWRIEVCQPPSIGLVLRPGSNDKYRPMRHHRIHSLQARQKLTVVAYCAWWGKLNEVG